ncbi:hypothetical protein I5F71_02725 [Pseudomonas aeruginosa]|nr:hypothetical protein [Pseudomonas aeruginosa]MBG4718161.1 hypothetical protein [Pseudomonas aeruginosa]
MLQVAIGALLLVTGLVTFFPYPILGVPMLIGGGLLVQKAPKGAGQQLQGAFFGLALLGLAITLLAGLFDILF